MTIAGAEGTFLQDFFFVTGSSAVDDTDINIGGFLRISSSDDGVFVDASSFARRVEVSIGAGDDDLEVEDSSFAAEVVANGGKGDDFLGASVGNTFAVEPVVNGFETIVV